MKHWLPLILFLIYCQNAHAQRTEKLYKLDHFGLSGPVKEVLTKNFIANQVEGNLTKGSVIPNTPGNSAITNMMFDRSGLLQRTDYYDRGEQPDGYRTCDFDERNRLTKYVIYNPDSSSYSILDFTYVDSSTVTVDGTSPTNLSESTKSTYTLDQQGSIVEIRREYYKSDTLEFWAHSYITSFSNMTAIYQKSMDNSVSSYLTITDDNGNQIETIHIDYFAYSYRISRRFDENSKILEEKNTRNGKTSTENYTYQLDEYGNWITKWTVKNGKPKFITTREIIYY